VFSTDTRLGIVCSMHVNAVLFGLGAIIVLSIPSLAEQAKFLIPAAVAASFALARSLRDPPPRC